MVIMKTRIACWIAVLGIGASSFSCTQILGGDGDYYVSAGGAGGGGGAGSSNKTTAVSSSGPGGGMDATAGAPAGGGGSTAAGGGRNCAGGETACTGVCVDLDKDPKNCGACGHDCYGSECQAALCQPVKLAAGQGPWFVAVDATNV